MNTRARPLALLLAATAEAVVIAVVVHLLLEGAGVIGVDLPVFVPAFAAGSSWGSRLWRRAASSGVGVPRSSW